MFDFCMQGGKARSWPKHFGHEAFEIRKDISETNYRLMKL